MLDVLVPKKANAGFVLHRTLAGVSLTSRDPNKQSIQCRIVSEDERKPLLNQPKAAELGMCCQSFPGETAHVASRTAENRCNSPGQTEES